MTFSVARCCRALAAAASVLAAVASPARAAETIAFVGALSGPAAPLGRDQRDGFLLALAERQDVLGGTGISVVEYDDGGEARRARPIADAIAAEGIPIVTGFTTTESALALHAALKSKAVLVSTGAGPVALAGEKCSRYFFSTAPAEDVVHENAGLIAQRRRYETVYIVASAATQAPVRSAFQRKFAGTISGVADTGEAIRQIRQVSPEAVYVALPGKEIRSFLQSYKKIGLFHRIPVIAADEGFLLDELRGDFSGLIVSARWSASGESSRSVDFVRAFERRYGRKPTVYALQGYDAALVLGAALRSLNGKPASPVAVSRALARQKVPGVEGPVRFAANGFPVTSWHGWEIFDDSGGATYLAPMKATLFEYSDSHSERCKLN